MIKNQVNKTAEVDSQQFLVQSQQKRKGITDKKREVLTCVPAQPSLWPYF